MFAALIIAALALSACGSSSSSSTEGAETAAAESEPAGGEETPAAEEEGEEETAGSGGGEGGKLGLLMDVARNDKSFGQATYEGAKAAAEELGLELTVVDNLANDPQKAQSALLNMAEEDQYVINGSIALMGGLPRIAEAHPETEFAVYAVSIPSADNLHWAYQDWYPLGYLAGVAAATETKSDVVGFVGGGEIPPTIAGQAAYDAAVEATNPKIKVVSTITGDFEDTAKAKDAAQAQIGEGADIIYSFVDAGHLGAVEAAKEAGNVKLIGVVIPKCEISQGTDLGDTISNQSQLIAEEVHGMVEGNAKNTVYGVQNPKVAGLKFCPGNANPEVEKAVEAAREEFVSGKLKTPAKYTSIQTGEE
ncbi:MAG TPA: BMP family ABC transporter substrate-binding protein [Solirubrobacterales bacterium]|jgi:basic membrane protein A